MNVVKPLITSYFKPLLLFPNELNVSCMYELLLRNVSKQVVFENPLNLPVKFQPRKA